VVTLTNTQTRRKAMTMAGIRERDASQRNELVFRCAESQCALAEIWTSSSDYGSIRPSKAIQRSLKRNADDPVLTAVLLMD
jgi:hypothetical protein